MKKLLVTGSSGLIGSEVVEYFSMRGWLVLGIDNNLRQHFFGDGGNTHWTRERLKKQLGETYIHFDIDIRNTEELQTLFRRERPAAIVHAAAQPSHDKAASIPFEDFDTNARGTLNILETARNFTPEAPFIFLSTNKVYGDSPNNLPLRELEMRWEYAAKENFNGIDEKQSIDQSTHSLFGASKLAADIMVQEYGRYFGMPTCSLRGGCLTGPNHSGVELHGFLSYLIKCNITSSEYTVYGYKGKQVRDNIHSLDVARFINEFINAPRSGEVYNIGGGRNNSCSILEAFTLVESLSNRPQNYTYDKKHRVGDHICYISNLDKIKSHYPNWNITITLKETIQQIFEGWTRRLGKH
jgi:CDP-paratose 2-epimerase